jgi:type VI secretion system protein VasD
MIRHRTVLFPSIVAVALAAVGCAKAPPPAPPAAPPPLTIVAPPPVKETIRVPMTLSAAADVNPGTDGKPSPIVVRVYLLRTDAPFKSADFFALYDDDQKLLQPGLISRDEFLLMPGEKRTMEVPIAEGTVFVGAIAAFRDIRNAEWRALAAPGKGFTVAVERARVVLTPVAK